MPGVGGVLFHWYLDEMNWVNGFILVWGAGFQIATATVNSGRYFAVAAVAATATRQIAAVKNIHTHNGRYLPRQNGITDNSGDSGPLSPLPLFPLKLKINKKK